MLVRVILVVETKHDDQLVSQTRRRCGGGFVARPLGQSCLAVMIAMPRLPTVLRLPTRPVVILVDCHARIGEHTSRKESNVATLFGHWLREALGSSQDAPWDDSTVTARHDTLKVSLLDDIRIDIWAPATRRRPRQDYVSPGPPGKAPPHIGIKPSLGRFRSVELKVTHPRHWRPVFRAHRNADVIHLPKGIQVSGGEMGWIHHLLHLPLDSSEISLQECSMPNA